MTSKSHIQTAHSQPQSLGQWIFLLGQMHKIGAFITNHIVSVYSIYQCLLELFWAEDEPLKGFFVLTKSN